MAVIQSTLSNTLLSGTSGNDEINNGGYWDGSRHSGGSNVTIRGGDGDDTVFNSGYGYIIGENGDDAIFNIASSVTIDGGNGNDYIDNRSENVIISSGDGNDTIYNMGGSKSSINGDSGDDYIYNSAKNVTISGGEGNDYISNNGKNVLFVYNEGDGNNYIEGFKTTSTLQIGDGTGTYSKSTSGKNIIVTVGEGKISLIGAASLSTVNIVGEKSSDETNSWKFSGTTATYGTDSKTLIKVTGVKSLDGISLSGKVVTVAESSLNKKKVTLTGSGYKLALADDVTTPTTKNAAWSLKSSTATYKSSYKTAGYKLASNGKSISYLKATTAEGLATIQGAKSKSFSVSGNKITLKNSALSNKVTVSGGYEFNFAKDYKNATITGSSKADTITTNGSNLLVKGGAGDDFITISGTNNIYKYASGDGNDIIKGFRADSTLSIGGGEYSTTKSGKNIIVTVGDGKITLEGAASLESSLNIAGTEKVTTPATLLTVNNSTKSPVTVGAAVKVINATARTKAVKITGNKLANSIAGGSGNDTLNGGKGNDTLTGGNGKDIFVYSAGKDLITDYAAEDKISITSGTAEVSTSGYDVIFTVGSGKITVTGGKDKTITYSDAGGKNKKYEYEEENSDEEIVILPKTYSKESYTMGNGVFTLDASAVRLDLNIVGNKFANSIIGSDQNDTLEGGKANDTLTGNGGSDVFVYNDGDGNDLITDYTEDEDTIQINGKVGKITPNGKDIIFTVGTGKISLKGAADKIISYIDADGEHTYGDTISPVEVNGKTVTLTENYTAESFDLSGYAKTMKTLNASAVTRDIKITANANANSIIGGSGNDTLIGGKGNDSLTGGEGSDVFIYNSGDGNDVIIDYAEEDRIKIASGKVSVKKNGKNVVFTVGSGKITVKGAATKTVTYIDANNKTHYYPTTPSSSIIWKDSNTTAILREIYSESTFNADSSIIKIDASAVTRDLSITGNGKANIILGGYEDDTINGGKGNDTLLGGSGADTFVYSNGDGKDIILDYAVEDTIKITKGTAQISTSDYDVIFTIGSGKITVLGAASKNVTYIEGGKTKTYVGSTSNILEDDNFITSDNLSALVEEKAADYSVVQENLIQKNNLLPSLTLSNKK